MTFTEKKTYTHERSFTTAPKQSRERGRGIVRTRCIDFCTILQTKYHMNEPLIQNAIRLFKKEMGIMDRMSIEHYFGTQTNRIVRRFHRTSRYASGTVSQKNIELEQHVPKREGYFEVLGLASILKNGAGEWVFVLSGEVLVPQFEVRHSEVGNSSIANLSLSSNQVEVKELEVNQQPTHSCHNGSNNDIHTHHIQSERDKIYGKIGEQKCIECGKQDPSNPQRILCQHGYGLRGLSDTCAMKEASP